MGKFCRWEIDIFLSFFSEKRVWRQFAWHMKPCLLEKKKKNSEYHLLTFLPSLLSVKFSWLRVNFFFFAYCLASWFINSQIFICLTVSCPRLSVLHSLRDASIKLNLYNLYISHCLAFYFSAWLLTFNPWPAAKSGSWHSCSWLVTSWLGITFTLWHGLLWPWSLTCCRLWTRNISPPTHNYKRKVLKFSWN